MGALEFWSTLIGDILSWPVAGLVIVLLLRRQLSELLTQLRSWEGPAGKFDFGKDLASSEKAADEVLRLLDTNQTGNVDITETGIALANQASENPSFVVIRSWELLNDSLNELGVATGAWPGPAARGRQVRSKGLEKLGGHEAVNESFIAAVDKLRKLRNQVAHGSHNPTPGEALTYAETAKDMKRVAQLLVDKLSTESATPSN